MTSKASTNYPILLLFASFQNIFFVLFGFCEFVVFCSFFFLDRSMLQDKTQFLLNTLCLPKKPIIVW